MAQAKRKSRPKSKAAAKRKTRASAKAAVKKTPRPRREGLSAEFIKRLQALTEASGVSGDESAVREIVLEAIEGHVDDVQVDALGNVIATKKSRGRTRLLATAHMDEVGVMIVAVDSDGLLQFTPVGGLDPRILLGKPMWVGAQRTPGVIGAQPIHLLKKSGERSQAPSLDGLRIDVGANSREAAGKFAQPGDRAVFAAPFAHNGPSLRGKALDDRLGVAVLIELLRGKPFPFQFTAAFTVQEEVGLRGARVSAFRAQPDAALVFEATPANDLPPDDADEENTRYNSRLGRGPALSVADASTLHDRRLIEHFANVARKNEIPFQYRQPGGGGNDAGAIHRSRAGVPSLGISVPARYIHSPAALVRAADVAHTIKLARAGLEALTPRILARA